MAVKKDKGKKNKKAKKQKVQAVKTISATSGVIDASRALAQKVYVEFTNDGELDFVLNPGDEEIRALWVALDVYDSDDTGLYTPYAPPEIEYPLPSAFDMAHELGISPEKIREWLRNETNYSKRGGSWVFTPEMVQAARERFPQQEAA